MLFADRLALAVQKSGSITCVGLDPRKAQLPAPNTGTPDMASPVCTESRAATVATACGGCKVTSVCVLMSRPGMGACTSVRGTSSQMFTVVAFYYYLDQKDKFTFNTISTNHHVISNILTFISSECSLKKRIMKFCPPVRPPVEGAGQCCKRDDSHPR